MASFNSCTFFNGVYQRYLDGKKNKSQFFVLYVNHTGTVSLPAKGYDSVNLPSGLYKRVKALVENRTHLGYRSIAEFVTEAVRKRTEEVETLLHVQRQLEEKSQVLK